MSAYGPVEIFLLKHGPWPVKCIAYTRSVWFGPVRVLVIADAVVKSHYRKVSVVITRKQVVFKRVLCVQVKDSNRISGRGRISCPFFEEIDAILGTRAASQPPALLESAGTAEHDPFPEVENDDGHQGN